MHYISEAILQLRRFLKLVTPVISLTFDLIVFLLPHILFGWIWVLFWAIRAAAIAVSKWAVPGIGNPLPTKDRFLLEKTDERHELSIVATMTVKGDISAKMVRGLFTGDVLHATLENSSKLRYPELQQYQTTFLGFHFWRDDPSFQIENHIFEVFHDDPNIPGYLKTFEGILAEFTGRPYAPQRSPWELYIIRNFDKGEGSPKTLAIWRAHHSQMDGFSMLNMLMSFLGEVIPVPPPVAMKQKELSYASKLFSMIRGYRKLISQISSNKLAKQSIAAAREASGGVPPKDKVHFKLSIKLPMSKLKELSSSFGVRVPALLVTLVADSISRVVKIDVGNVFGVYAIPLGGHPEILVNHASLTTLQLPLIKSQPIAAKLMAINESFHELKWSPCIWLNRYTRYILGTFPSSVYRFIGKKLMYTPISITNFAVSSRGIQYGGLECLEIRGGIGVPKENTGSFVTIVGYKSDVQILFAGHDSLFSEEDATRIAYGIEEGFEKLLEEAAARQISPATYTPTPS